MDLLSSHAVACDSRFSRPVLLRHVCLVLRDAGGLEAEAPRDKPAGVQDWRSTIEACSHAEGTPAVCTGSGSIKIAKPTSCHVQ